MSERETVALSNTKSVAQDYVRRKTRKKNGKEKKISMQWYYFRNPRAVSFVSHFPLTELKLRSRDGIPNWRKWRGRETRTKAQFATLPRSQRDEIQSLSVSFLGLVCIARPLQLEIRNFILYAHLFGKISVKSIIFIERCLEKYIYCQPLALVCCI